IPTCWRDAMAEPLPPPEPIGVAILTKAPIPGLAKTRLVPALGREGAARLQSRLITRAVEAACRARVGPVTLWATPDAGHPLFTAMTWGVPSVLTETRRRIASIGLTVRELAPLWDLDVPEDLARLEEAGLGELLAPEDLLTGIARQDR